MKLEIATEPSILGVVTIPSLAAIASIVVFSTTDQSELLAASIAAITAITFASVASLT